MPSDCRDLQWLATTGAVVRQILPRHSIHSECELRSLSAATPFRTHSRRRNRLYQSGNELSGISGTSIRSEGASDSNATDEGFAGCCGKHGHLRGVSLTKHSRERRNRSTILTSSTLSSILIATGTVTHPVNRDSSMWNVGWHGVRQLMSRRLCSMGPTTVLERRQLIHLVNGLCSPRAWRAGLSPAQGTSCLARSRMSCRPPCWSCWIQPGSFGASARRDTDHAELLKHSQLIEVVPALDQLPSLHSDKNHP